MPKRTNGFREFSGFGIRPFSMGGPPHSPDLALKYTPPGFTEAARRKPHAQISGGPKGKWFWLNPFRPEVWQKQFKITELVLGSVGNTTANGIQFPMTHMKPCPIEFWLTNSYTKALFNTRETSGAGAEQPDGSKAGSSWRADKISPSMVSSCTKL